MRLGAKIVSESPGFSLSLRMLYTDTAKKEEEESQQTSWTMRLLSGLGFRV
jgi:hypothetical protein